MSSDSKYYLQLTRKIIHTINKLDNMDNILEKKYNKNTRELELYQKMIDTANENFYIIVKNLK